MIEGLCPLVIRLLWEIMKLQLLSVIIEHVIVRENETPAFSNETTMKHGFRRTRAVILLVFTFFISLSNMRLGLLF